MTAEFTITGDLDTGVVHVSGPVNDMRLVHWMLGEALRACERVANQRDSGSNGRAPLILVPDVMPVPPAPS